MATIDATARYTNATARLFSYVNGLTITGAPKIVPEGSMPDDSPKFVRLTFVPVSADHHGEFNSTQQAIYVRVLLVADLFWRDAAEEGEVWDAYQVSRAADDLAHELRGLTLQMYDYSSTPQNPTAIAGAYLRALEPPTVTTLDFEEGWQRRQISVEFTWYLRHTR